TCRCSDTFSVALQELGEARGKKARDFRPGECFGELETGRILVSYGSGGGSAYLPSAKRARLRTAARTSAACRGGPACVPSSPSRRLPRRSRRGRSCPCARPHLKHLGLVRALSVADPDNAPDPPRRSLDQEALAAAKPVLAPVARA